MRKELVLALFFVFCCADGVFANDHVQVALEHDPYIFVWSAAILSMVLSNIVALVCKNNIDNAAIAVIAGGITAFVAGAAGIISAVAFFSAFVGSAVLLVFIPSLRDGNIIQRDWYWMASAIFYVLMVVSITAFYW